MALFAVDHSRCEWQDAGRAQVSKDLQIRLDPEDIGGTLEGSQQASSQKQLCLLTMSLATAGRLLCRRKHGIPDLESDALV